MSESWMSSCTGGSDGHLQAVMVPLRTQDSPSEDFTHSFPVIEFFICTAEVVATRAKKVVNFIYYLQR